MEKLTGPDECLYPHRLSLSQYSHSMFITVYLTDLEKLGQVMTETGICEPQLSICCILYNQVSTAKKKLGTAFLIFWNPSVWLNIISTIFQGSLSQKHECLLCAPVLSQRAQIDITK